MDFYLILVVVLVALAISDLVVGVSNDAVNFLNSAIGSKVAPRHIVMIVASLGILLGAVFSNGMMEVARKGIFHPQHFYFTEIMVIFIAVMITDILLLDFFNTIGLPTSTTVSIVFELLGAAVSVAVVKLAMGDQMIIENGIERIAEMSDYINSAKALSIISGILLSVVVAFSVGAIVQWISRFLFTFNFEKPIKYFGAIWGGIAITAITYFILIKGAKSASFMTAETKDFIKNNGMMIIGFSFVGWTIILQILNWLFKTNILRVIVIVGTFALAMAFAGNDLVNFIGVPLAGFQSYQQWDAGGQVNMLMTGMAGKVPTPPWFLVVAGAVMVVTLWFSKKARSVTETELKLSRQDEGDERFGSSLLARILVRRVITTGTFFSTIIPESFSNKIKARFDRVEYDRAIAKQKNPPMFDLIRASVNLTVASILISFATSLKLPLSTTYVTFMVAMGTSLADGAWGRDSAVYRITGVMTVIGGWFMTAIVAFTVAFLVALFFSWNKEIAFGVMVILVLFALYKTHKAHKKKTEANTVVEEEDITENVEKIVDSCNTHTVNQIDAVAQNLQKAIEAFNANKIKQLRKELDNAKEIDRKSKKVKDNVLIRLGEMKDISLEAGKFYVQVVDYQRELAHSLNYIVRPLYEHMDNNHKEIREDQKEDLIELTKMVSHYLNLIKESIASNDFGRIEEIVNYQEQILKNIDAFRKHQIKRIKGKEAGTKNSLLYLNVMVETRNLLFKAINIFKSSRDFVNHSK